MSAKNGVLRVCVRAAGVSAVVLAPVARRSVIGGRGRSFGHCGAPSSHDCAYASRPRHEPSLTRHVHRSSLVVVVARRAGVCVRAAGVSTVVLAPAARRSVIGGRGRSFGHCGAPSSLNCTRASRARHESSRTCHVIARRSSLSSRGVRGFACARRGSRPSSSRPRRGDR